MNKIEVLENTIKQVEASDTLLRYYYTNEQKDCFCAVGHIMERCGVDMDQLLIYREEEQERLNGKDITALFNFEDVMAPLIEAGFDYKELDRLQGINDGIGDNTERKEEVLQALKTMLDNSFPF